MKYQALSDVDPASRVLISLAVNEDRKSIADKIFDALSDDLFMVKLQQLAWHSFKESNLGYAYIMIFRALHS
jgi:acetone carboxylase gamma subunit